MFDINVSRITNSQLLKSAKEAYKKEYLQDFNPNAFYIAIVESTDDTYKLGRVQIRIPAIHGTNSSQYYYLPSSALPWARPAILNGAGNDMGQFIVPTRGSRVVVTFEYNDIDKPLYFGGVPTLIGATKHYNDNSKVFDGDLLDITTDDRITDLENSSAQQVIYKSLKGSTIIIDDKDGKESIKIIDAAGQQIIMENESEDPLPRRGNKTEPPTTANIKIVTNGKLNLDCKEFDLQAENTNLSRYVTPDVVLDDLDSAFAKRFYETKIGNDIDSAFEIKHNLDTRNVFVTVYETESPYQEVIPNIFHTDLNTITVEFTEPPTTNQYTIAIHKIA